MPNTPTLIQKAKLISQYPEPPEQAFYNEMSYNQDRLAFIAKRAEVYERYRREGMDACEIAIICEDPPEAPVAYIAIVGPVLAAMMPVELSDVVIESKFAEDMIWNEFVADVVENNLKH